MAAAVQPQMTPARFRLQELLDEREISQSELSRTSGVSFATISRMCRNVTAQVSLETLDKLAVALKVEPGDIIVRKRGR
jgi:DNA-binding Xre family transcriptional regulator